MTSAVRALAFALSFALRSTSGITSRAARERPRSSSSVPMDAALLTRAARDAARAATFDIARRRLFARSDSRSKDRARAASDLAAARYAYKGEGVVRLSFRGECKIS